MNKDRDDRIYETYQKIEPTLIKIGWIVLFIVVPVIIGVAVGYWWRL